MSNRHFKLGIHPINWVGEDVREHGDDTTFEMIVDDIAALGLTGTEMGRKFPKDRTVLKRELDARGIQLVSSGSRCCSLIPITGSRSWRITGGTRSFWQDSAKVISTAEVGDHFTSIPDGRRMRVSFSVWMTPDGKAWRKD